MRGSWHLFVSGLLAVLAGGLLAHLIQTSAGIRVQDVRFTGTNKTAMSGLLYLPAGATATTPAPGILAVHGYINSRETQSGFAIEYARRGYVVLALDQTGHGYSGGAAFTNGFGGPDGLKYLRGLDCVDPANIGLEGHSMGGGAILAAARAHPDGYKSMVLEGSATATLFSPAGDARFPRNLAVVFSKYDEFSQLMWGVGRASDVASSPKLQALFGTGTAVVSGRIYGAIEAGTARVLRIPVTTHPGDHLSFAAIGDSLDWFAKTLQGARAKPHTDQIWIWKEMGTLIAMAGAVLMMLGVFDLLLALPGLATLRQPGLPTRQARDAQWWLAFALTALLPVLTFYPFFHLGNLLLPPSQWLPQRITNQILAWALLNAGITLLLSRLFRSTASRSPLQWSASLAIASGTVATGYAALALTDYFFQVDFRFWVVALKLLSAERFLPWLVYLIPFTLTFIVASRALHDFLVVQGDSAARQYWVGIAALALGFAVFLIVQYVPLFTVGHLIMPSQALNAIISIQFLPLMIILALIAMFTWRRTNSYLPGALISGMFMTWYIVAGTATHVVG